ncbi:MAG: hypothetical protein ACP5SD_08085 [Elusimicrobiales bacterium]
MKRYFIIAFLFLSSCVSSSKVSIVPRSELIELSKKEKIPYKTILVQWKNYKYSDYHKVNYLEKTPEDVLPAEVDEKDYKNFKKKVINIFRENGLYDEVNGTGTVKISLITYGRWDYSELFSTYLVDTGYVLLLPSSITVTYRMTVKAEQNGKEAKIQNESSVKTTFFFLLFPLYPFSTFSGSEKTVLNNMIYKTAVDLSKS